MPHPEQPPSRRAQRIRPSATLEVIGLAKALEAQGKRVIAFAAGEPDLPIPESVRAAAIAAIGRGEGRYTAASGMPQLREAAARRLTRYGQPYAANEVICCAGGKPAIAQALWVLVDPGAEVLFPAPYWTSYPDICLAADAVPVPVLAPAGDDFQIAAAALEAAITERSRVLFLNSPNNPTGTVYSRATLQAVADVARRHDLWIISDDIYRHLVYSDEGFVSILDVAPDLRPRTIIVDSLSKSHSLTGWRIGYAAGPKDVIAAMGHLQSQVAGNPNTITQIASLVAMDEDPAPERAGSIDRRRLILLEALASIPDLPCPIPRGAFYAFPDASAYIGRRHGDVEIADDVALARLLLEEKLVATVPGSAFGAPGHLRLTYCCPDADIIEGVERLRDLLLSLR